MPYKFYYFDIRGAGEPTRMIFNYAGEKFEDLRLDQAKWQELKPRLVGKDDWEQAKVDEIVDFFKDVQKELGEYLAVAAGFKQGDKKKLKAEVFLPAVERAYPVLQKILKESGSGFLVKSGVTWADFLVAESLSSYGQMEPEVVKKYPDLAKYVEKVHSVPQLKKYIEGRKKSPF